MPPRTPGRQSLREPLSTPTWHASLLEWRGPAGKLAPLRSRSDGNHRHQCRRVIGLKLKVHSVVLANNHGQRRESARNGQRCPVGTGVDPVHRGVGFQPRPASSCLLSPCTLNTPGRIARTPSASTGLLRGGCAGPSHDDDPASVAALAPPIPRMMSAATDTVRATRRSGRGRGARPLGMASRLGRFAATIAGPVMRHLRWRWELPSRVAARQPAAP